MNKKELMKRGNAVNNETHDRSEALSQTHKVMKVVEAMRRGEVVSFSFKKTNGEIRKANGALSFNGVSTKDAVKGVGRPTPDQNIFFVDADLVKKNDPRPFRSFKIRDFIGIEA